MTSVRRLLGLGDNVGGGHGVLSIDLGSRRVTITVSHVGIDRDVIKYRLKHTDTCDKAAALRARLQLDGRIVIGGVEMLNVLQGPLLKLRAFEQLLQQYPTWRSRLTLLQESRT